MTDENQPVKEDNLPMKSNTGEELSQDNLVKIYQEVCTNIRTSDDISFKLLGFVPLLSGGGAAILSLKNISDHPLAVLLASVIGAIFTFGLFRWEMRNVQKCTFLIDTAADIEKNLFKVNVALIGQYSLWNTAARPRLFKKLPEPKELAVGRWDEIGKTQAERIIYWSSIAAWLVPILMAVKLKQQ